MLSNVNLPPVLLSMLFLLLSSCSALNKSTDTPVLQTERYIEHGEYEETFALLSRSCDHYQEGNNLPAECRLNFERILQIADRHFEKKDFAKAGILYRLLMESGATGNYPPGALSLREKITKCARVLTGEGLVQYREEKLDKAISLWEQVLSFDPENESVKKAITSANRQQQYLKNIR